MATYAELNQAYKAIYDKDFSPSTLSKWVKENKIAYIKNSNNTYNYDLNSFLQIIQTDTYQKQIRAKKKKPQDYIGKTCGELLIIGIVPKEEYQTQYQGTMMYCKCLNCGKIIQERFAYVSGNGNYSRESCGCLRVMRHFLASTNILDNTDIDWLKQFQQDWDRFSFLNYCIVRTGIKTEDWENKEIYKQFYEYFWNDKQFNTIYDLWMIKKNSNYNTFYDWWKPSIDHKIPKSRGGTNNLDNLQFLTFYENHNKLDMTWEEWCSFKQETNTTSKLYLEQIMKGGDAHE